MSNDRNASSGDERRRYPRLQRPVFYRVPSFFDRWKSVCDVGLGGCRIYSDEENEARQADHPRGAAARRTTVRARARVVWTKTVPEGGPAAYEVGLEFLSVNDESWGVLTQYLETPQE